MSVTSAPPLADEARRAVADYTERLSELLESCAVHQDADPEVFLWNARRALEAICLILMTAYRGKVARLTDERAGDGALYSLIKELTQRGVLSREDNTRFNMARSHSNLGVHIRQPEREDYRKARDDLGHMLPGLVDWLFEESVAAAHLARDPRIINALADIREGGRRERPAVTMAPEQALPAPTPPPSQRSGNSRLLLGMLGAAGTMVLAATGLSLADRDAPFAPEPELAAVQLEGAMAASQAAPAQAAADPAAAVPAPTCPQGMVLVGATIIWIGQPEGGRADWPEPRSERLLPQEIDAFCIDQAARTWAEFQAWQGSARVFDDACDWRTTASGPSAPVSCVTRDEAAAHCTDTASGGQLPSLLQWEAVARLPEPHRIVRDIRREWIADDFPAEVFDRVPPTEGQPREGMFRGELLDSVEPAGNVLLSWSRQPLDNRWRNLGFRCASPPI